MNTRTKWLVGIFGTIVLGALGSGLWQIILGPLVYKIGRIFLGLLSLIFVTLNNNIFQEIAKGFHESHSLFLLELAVGGLAGILISLIVLNSNLRRKERANKLVPGILDSKRAYYIWILASIFSLSFLLGGLFIAAYENLYITRFEQILTICSPYISQNETSKFHSQFAQIKSKIDYENIVSSLENIAKSNNLSLPKIIFWY